VDKVELVNGIVFHRGTFVEGEFGSGAIVDLEVHEATRLQNAKLHSGGHLIMTAMDSLRQMKAIKGYHFPDGAYVEFQGVVPESERASLAKQAQQFIDQAIEQGGDVTAALTSLAELEAEGVFIPMEIPRDKPTRVVITCGYKSPCGGTHVSKLIELKGLKIRSLKAKSGNTRISYGIE
jgi:alanyl-tRNA synthetase